MNFKKNHNCCFYNKIYSSTNEKMRHSEKHIYTLNFK